MVKALRRALKITAILSVMIAAAWAPDTARAAGRWGEESFVLPNGLQVIVVPNHRAPLVTHWVWYKVGGADEERGRSGAAHFLEHLMFKGTKTQKPKEFSDTIARVGGEENAFTSWDYTAFHQTVAASQLELVMRLESDRMQNLVISDQELRPERDVVLEEWRMRIGNQPEALLDEQIEAALYLNHPYRIPVLGWPDEIKMLDVAAEKHFYDTWYAPNNAVLMVAGDVTVERVKALAQHFYGPIPRRPVPVRSRLQEPDRKADVTVKLADTRVRQPQWARYLLAPSYRTSNDDMTPYALQVLAGLLGDGAAGRLHKALVLDQPLATEIEAFYEPSRYDLGRFGFAAGARPDVPLDKIGAAVDVVVDDLLKNGATADEVARAKKRIVTTKLYAEDDLIEPLMIIGRALTTGQTLDQLDRWPDRIDAVTVDDVNRAAHALFDGKTSVTALLLPAANTTGEPVPLAPPSSGEIR